MKARIFRWLSIILLVSSSYAYAQVVTVDDNGPADYSTIQDAINNSFDGYVIEVSPGIYHENINFYGKALTIKGLDPSDINNVYATTIDGSGVGNVVTFDSGEDEGSKIIGITIQDGGTNGIYCYYSSPLISSNTLAK